MYALTGKGLNKCYILKVDVPATSYHVHTFYKIQEVLL